MNRLIERRQSERRADESVSLEFLKVLEVCGGELRRSDRAALAGERGDARGTSDRRKADRTAADRAESAGAAPEGRGVDS